MDAASIAAIGMQRDVQTLQSISQNVANVTSVAYKREIQVNRPFTALMDQQMATQETVRDNTDGTRRATSNPLDLAIEGDGYFEVMTETGPAYTRQGNMHVDERGRLATSLGALLIGQGGELSVGNGPIAIDSAGEVRQKDRNVGRIKIVRFANAGGLLALGNGLFAQGTAKMEFAEGTRLRSGYLENSNVNSSREMVRLTETARHFESMQKIMQGLDETFEKTMRKLGEF
jgi:flagellar basal-body rod protein FlgG